MYVQPKSFMRFSQKKDKEYSEKYKKRHHGEIFKGRGVIRLELTEAEDNGFKNQWNKILDGLYNIDC